MMVGDSSSTVRVEVAQALFLLNDAQAFDALLEQLAREDDADVAHGAGRALVPMRDVRVVEPLLKLLRDPSLAVAEVAARGLSDSNLAPLIQKDPALARANRGGVARGAPAPHRAAGDGVVPGSAGRCDGRSAHP